MSGKLLDLRRRIRSVKNTQKITRAMKTVSAAKLRRSLLQMKNNQAYLDRIKTVLERSGVDVDIHAIPWFQSDDEGKNLIVSISGDKGLCGAFNTHIVRRTVELYKETRDRGREAAIICIGKKTADYFSKGSYPVHTVFKNMMSRLNLQTALELSGRIKDIFIEEKPSRLEVVYTRFVSAANQEAAVRTLFPLEMTVPEPDEGAPESIFEPSAQKVFEELLPEYIDSLLYGILRESETSEHAARMIAMELATRNADDMIRQLTLTMNKARQTAITKELLEIITATEALSQ